MEVNFELKEVKGEKVSDSEEDSSVLFEISDEPDVAEMSASNVEQNSRLFQISDELDNAEIGDSEEDNSALFQISIEPENAKVSAPIYNAAYDIYNQKNAVEEEKPKRNKNSCWNCGAEDHALRQCKRPFDNKAISLNKSKFIPRPEFKRYHVKSKNFTHLSPGSISKKLRGALGIRKYQLPSFIYKMRGLGYPPGWLLNAKTEYSGIEMFGIEGNRIPNADEEEGEIGSSNERISYDESKIINYPGFNVLPASEIKDETAKYGAPQMDFTQSKEELIKNIKNSAHARKNLDVVKSVSTGDSDMEVDEDIQLLADDKCAFIPPLPEEHESPPLPSSPPPHEDSDGLNDSVPVHTDNDDIINNSNPKEILINSLFNTPKATHGTTKSIDFGTPVVKIHSTYSGLPSTASFKKDISDVINFENLPDSTGAYTKLKGVLKHTRSRMSEIKELKLNNTI